MGWRLDGRASAAAWRRAPTQWLTTTASGKSASRESAAWGAGRGRALVRWARTQRRTLIGDALRAAAVVAGEVLLTVLAPPQAITQGAGGVAGDAMTWSILGWSLLGAAPIVIRRAATRWSVAACLIILAASLGADHDPLSHAVSYLAVTYTVADRLSARAATIAAVLLWLPVVIANLFNTEAQQAAGISPALPALLNVVGALVAFFIGRALHARRAAGLVLRERAIAAEANQRTLAAQAVADERRRIARELHDVVAHHVSVISVLAAGARRVLDRDPATADEALGTIEATSRSTLREMRRLLDVLRTDAEGPDAELAPQPGLAGISGLVDQIREAGLPVSLEVTGDPAPLDPGVALTVYRIVQEALTNTLKHAGTATAAVSLRFDRQGVDVRISDTGRGPGPYAGDAGVGHGLVGMRERVALYRGRLSAGSGAGGGFAVQARIPFDQLDSPV
jgi:signal transduction histidine kinase